MGAPVEDWRAIPLARAADLDALPLEGAPSAVGMGNPHCVFVVADAEAAPVETLGPLVERDPLFPERTNVEFVQLLDRETIRMRVWERGLGVTLACGSGACAAVVATARRGLTGRRVTVRLDGGPLGIDWRADGVWMTGPVAEVFEGTLSAGFSDGEPVP
jgi:diaminopimelate epimerase